MKIVATYQQETLLRKNSITLTSYTSRGKLTEFTALNNEQTGAGQDKGNPPTPPLSSLAVKKKLEISIRS